MKIRTLDLQAQFRSVEPEVRAAIERVLASQQFILGEEGAAFEREMAEYTECEHAIGVSSGTDAILVGLMALGVGQGDEVITSPYTFVATATCIARLGARPVFVDINPQTYAMSSALLEDAITARTKAIVPVHLFGLMADMDAINAIARAHRVPVLEDAAQAIGARRNDHPPGFGSIGATLSFFPSKNLGCMGDGGMVVTNDAGFANKVRLLRNQGQQPKYTTEIVGGNFRLDELQAAILRAKLPRLESWTDARRQLAERYRKGLADVRDLSLPKEPPNVRHVYNQFVVRTPRRDALRSHLTARDIDTAVYYPVPMHKQPCFAGLEHGALPESERAAKESLALPLYPELEDAAIERVITEVTSFLGS